MRDIRVVKQDWRGGLGTVRMRDIRGLRVDFRVLLAVRMSDIRGSSSNIRVLRGV